MGRTPVCTRCQVFLFYRRLIRGFAQRSTPLNVLAGKGASFTRTKSSDAVLTSMKRSLTKAPVLAYPDFSVLSDSFVLDTNAGASEGGRKWYGSTVRGSPRETCPGNFFSKNTQNFPLQRVSKDLRVMTHTCHAVP